jgi:hypothetical protein
MASKCIAAGSLSRQKTLKYPWNFPVQAEEYCYYPPVKNRDTALYLGWSCQGTAEEREVVVWSKR